GVLRGGRSYNRLGPAGPPVETAKEYRGASLGAIEKLGSFGEGRKRKRLQEYVALVNSFEPELEDLDDAALKARSQELRQRHQESEDELDEVLPEAFAMVREAARRTIGQRHYDVQVMGAVVLHQGSISEMRTGEGKTLVSTMP